jgi:thiamine phosphate synthase YjbQ (UPF0047 family)
MDAENDVPAAPPWPSLLTEITQAVERFHRQGEISDGQLLIFGMSMVWHSTRELTVPDRRAKICEILNAMEEEEGVSSAANDSGHVQPGGKRP